MGCIMKTLLPIQHPYPTKEQVRQLADVTGLNPRQVQKW